MTTLRIYVLVTTLERISIPYFEMEPIFISRHNHVFDYKENILDKALAQFI